MASEPHVLRYDPTRSGRQDSFFSEQSASGIWRIDVYATRGALQFHAVVFAHEPFRDGHRRKDREGHPCLLLEHVSEDVYRLESCRIHPDAPRCFYDLINWVAPKDAA